MLYTQEKVKMYKLSGRIMDGAQLIGYQLIDSDGATIKAKKDDVEKLAAKSKIVNCTVTQLNGKNYIKGIGIRISELPAVNIGAQHSRSSSIKTMEIAARIVDGASVLGYVVKDITGKQYKLSREKVWQLARGKVLSNATAQLNGRQKVLRGVGIELRDLPEVRF